MKSFAVAVLTYNHPNISRDCIDSILKICPSESIRIIHNGSLVKHQELLQKEFQDLEHLINPENKGYSGGFNFTMRNLFSHFDWVYFLTNDTQLLSLGSLPSQPGLYAPLIYRRHENKIDSLGGAFSPSEEKIYHVKSEKEFHQLPPHHFPYIPGTAMLIHKMIWEQVGEMDESLHTYWEDVDFSQRVREKELFLGLCPSFKLIHKVGKTCHKSSFYTKYLFQRNKKIVSERYC